MKAKLTVACYWADCGKCGESLSDPFFGSQLIEINKEYRTLECHNCGEVNEIRIGKTMPTGGYSGAAI
jgi:transcription elongation factor Elf1